MTNRNNSHPSVTDSALRLHSKSKLARFLLDVQFTHISWVSGLNSVVHSSDSGVNVGG